jgi:2-keto-4-pentenoate hydratase
MAKTLIEKTANKLVDAFINNKIIAPLPSKFTENLKMQKF